MGIFFTGGNSCDWGDYNAAEIFANLTLQNILPEFDPQEFIYVVSIMAF